MGQKRFTPEQIIGKLRQAEVRSAEGATVAEIVRELGITDQTYHRWRREYNTIRPHSSLGYRPPAPQAVRPRESWLRRPVLQGPGLAAGLT